MLKELFEGSFYVTYPKKRNVLLNIQENIHRGQFTLCDPLACRDCRVCQTRQDERVNLLLSSPKSISGVSVHQVIENIEDPVGKTCDYVLADDQIFIFIEMSCSEEQYVNVCEGGKRMRARAQLNNTIHVFSANPDVGGFISRREKRFAIFSWKDMSKAHDEGDNVERGLAVFTKMGDDMYSEGNRNVLDNGFSFLEVRYPQVLKLSEL